MSFIKYIADERSAQRDACPSKNHYKEVLSLVGKAKQMVWIAMQQSFWKNNCLIDGLETEISL